MSTDAEEESRVMRLRLRPENVEITDDETCHDNAFEGDVIEVTEMGSYAEARIRTEAGEVLTKVGGFSGVTEGKEVVVVFDDSDAVVVSGET
jgi:ABC-type sugar transport system ATPase subunit